jgi:hypothetical protein
MEQELYEYLKKLGFSQIFRVHMTHLLFKHEDELIALPKGKLQERHYRAVGKHLDENGWVKRKEFDKMFTNKIEA